MLCFLFLITIQGFIHICSLFPYLWIAAHMSYLFFSSLLWGWGTSSPNVQILPLLERPRDPPVIGNPGKWLYFSPSPWMSEKWWMNVICCRIAYGCTCTASVGCVDGRCVDEQAGIKTSSLKIFIYGLCDTMFGYNTWSMFFFPSRL